MSAEDKSLEKNALAAKLSGGWTKFKQGKLIGYKWMGLFLLLVAGIGTWWYISSARKTDNSKRWVQFEEAHSIKLLEELEKAYPDKIQGRLARLQIARHQLGPAGIDLLGSLKAEERQTAVANIEAAKKSFEELLGKFKDDLVFRVECLHGLAQAEAALIAVPLKDEPEKKDGIFLPQTEFKGEMSKLITLLDQVAEAAEGTPWGNNAKSRAAQLRDPVLAKKFESDQREFYRPFTFGGPSPIIPGAPQEPKIPFLPGP